MRNIRGISVLSMLAILLFAFNGCGDGDSEIQSNVITENDLFANSQLIATPEQTLVIQLEASDGEGQVNDIGEKGVDEVPVYYSESVNHTFCWEDDTSDAGHSMELIDSSRNIVLIEYIDSECTGATIPAGHYTMRFIHGGQSEDTQTIFIRLGEDNGSSKGIVNAASVQDNIDTLISTNSCRGCDLEGANLSRANLNGAYLNEANLTKANLFYAKLSDAKLSLATLSYADLSYAYMPWANLIGADMNRASLFGAHMHRANLFYAKLSDAKLNITDISYANLSYAYMAGANLTGASLTNAILTNTYLPYANLSQADLSYADLTGANLVGVNLTKALLSGATWVDGTTICGEGSIGECL